MWLRAVAGILILMTSYGCSDSNLKGGFASASKTKKRQVAESVSSKANDDSKGESVSLGTTESFQTKGSSGKVDIAWYVDQSGSMKDETANVQKNFAAFMESVNAIADTRVALVAQTSGRNAISIEPIADKQIQIDQYVDSRDSLLIAINTFVRPGMPLPAGVEEYDNSLSKLSGFFRADVPAIVVIVTDDDAREFRGTTFEELSKDTLGKVPKLFAFRATNASTFKNEPEYQIARRKELQRPHRIPFH